LIDSHCNFNTFEYITARVSKACLILLLYIRKLSHYLTACRMEFADNSCPWEQKNVRSCCIRTI